MEYQITGYLGILEIAKRDKFTVANFYVANGGQFSKKDNRYITNWFPIECWVEKEIKRLKEIPKGSLISVNYTAVPRTLKMDTFSRTIIIWKATKIIYWSSNGVKTKNEMAEQTQLPLSWEDSQK